MTPEQKLYILSHKDCMSNREIAKYLGIGISAVSHYCSINGGKKHVFKASSTKLPPEKVEFIREHYKDMTLNQMSSYLGIHETTVCRVKKLYGLTGCKPADPKKEVKLTSEMKKFIMENYKEVRTDKMAEMFHVNKATINHYLRKNGIHGRTERPKKNIVPSNKKITSEELQWIRENFDDTQKYEYTLKKFNANFGKDFDVAYFQQACNRLLGLYTNYREKFAAGSAMHCYELGKIIMYRDTPYIKVNDKRKSELGRTATKKDNFIRLDKYIWERTTGKELSEDDILVHIDGDKKNCDYSNLFKITKGVAMRFFINGWQNLADPDMKKLALTTLMLEQEALAKQKEMEKTNK